MVNGGDELGRSQGGNNNAYCQDNEVSWFDWDLKGWQEDLLETTRFLTRLRADNPVLRQRSFFTERRAHQDRVVDPQWFATDGEPMRYRTWDDPNTRTLTMFLDGTRVDGGNSLLIIFHGGAQDAEVVLPARDDGATYHLIWDSTWEHPQPRAAAAAGTVDPAEAGTVIVVAASIRVYSLSR
jgi:glycogen operon protein